MPTKLIRGLSQLRPEMQGAVVTIGNFDGVHLGHQQLLTVVSCEAGLRHVPSMLITFEPHPFEFFNQDKPTVARLTRLREKYLALAVTKVDYVLILSFNQAIANMSATDFADKLLGQILRISHIVVGDDFRFGHKRQGDIALLRQLGFSVNALPSVIFQDARISSTRIREVLAVGDFNLAAEMLGRPYTMAGRVRYGDQIGQKLGFPTANIFLQRRLTPIAGVFTVLVHGLGAKPIQGAANLGTRPAVDGTKTLLEVHLLDFNQNIYGRYVTVQFCQKLRDEVHYPSLALLREQIAKDVIATREYFQNMSV